MLKQLCTCKTCKDEYFYPDKMDKSSNPKTCRICTILQKSFEELVDKIEAIEKEDRGCV